MTDKVSGLKPAGGGGKGRVGPWEIGGGGGGRAGQGRGEGQIRLKRRGVRSPAYRFKDNKTFGCQFSEVMSLFFSLVMSLW